MSFRKVPRNYLEHIVVIIVVLVVAFLVSANIYYQRQEARQRAVFYQLQIIRNAVNLYKIVEKRNPVNLSELAHGIYKFPGDRETRKFMTNVPFGEKGGLVDPFGNYYVYDRGTGWVRSSTPGYEMW